MPNKEIQELKQELERLNKFYNDELKRKDKMIDELRKDNEIILRTAMKQSEKINNLTEKLKKALKLKK